VTNSKKDTTFGSLSSPGINNVNTHEINEPHSTTKLTGGGGGQSQVVQLESMCACLKCWMTYRVLQIIKYY
jgi:hypothetical protein